MKKQGFPRWPSLRKTAPGTSQANRIYAALREEIQRGKLSEGTRLIEADLAKSLRASRTPVREALGRLQGEGLVANLPGRGLVVPEFSIEEILELYEIQTALETTATRLAARVMTPFDLERLRKIQRELELAVTESEPPEVLRDITTRFHQQICATTKSRYLQEFTQRIYDMVLRSKETTLAFPGRPQEVIEEHRAILAALEGRDEELAETLAREHARKVMTIRIALIA